MNRNYIGQFADYEEEEEWYRELDSLLHGWGGLVYNSDYNSFQFIRRLEDINIKKEMIPSHVLIKELDSRHSDINGLELEVHYEFDPETEEDPNQLKIYRELCSAQIPSYDYDEEGELIISKESGMDHTPSKHLIWLLDEEAREWLENQDMLMIMPIFKQRQLAEKLFQLGVMNPFDAEQTEASEDISRYGIGWNPEA